MNSGIGSQLENARKTLGLSLAEAAEATKIRTDFLSHFENNNFDIGLPEVYRQGFLKLYSNYLKLDGEELVREYRKQRGMRLKTFRQERVLGNSFYSEESQQELEAEDSFLGGKEMGYEARNFQKGGEESYGEENSSEDERLFVPPASVLDRSTWIKLASIFGIALGIILLLAYGMSKFFGSKESSTIQTIATTSIPSNAADKANAEEEVFLIATGNVHVIVRQESDKKRLFSGNLVDGDRIAIKKNGRIKILFSEGQNLILEKGGHQYGMNAQGNAIRVFD